MARTCRKNKQKMFYSLPNGVYEVYETNPDGSIKYIEVDGELVPVPTGTTKTGYTDVVEFHASLSGKLNELHAQSWGVSQNSIYAELCCEKGRLPFDYNTKVWREDKVEYTEDGRPDPDSATYTVKGLLTEFQDFDWYLLQRNNVQEGSD